MPIGRHGRQLLALLSFKFGRTPPFPRIEQRNRLKEIGIANRRDDARRFIVQAERVGEALTAAFRLVVAVPVFTQFMAGCRIHRGHEFEGVQRLASCVDLLEHNANRFFRCRTVQRDHGDAVVFEILQNLPLESSELLDEPPCGDRPSNARQSRPASGPNRRPVTPDTSTQRIHFRESTDRDRSCAQNRFSQRNLPVHRQSRLRDRRMDRGPSGCRYRTSGALSCFSA